MATPQASAPSGFTPSGLLGAYGLSATGAGKTIALVDAYDDPTIAANLTSFSSQFGLPACTTASGCFTKVNQTGGTSYPAATTGWDLEISLDVEWAHALAPNAHILLVEATSNSDTNLFAAVRYAGAHAQYVSMSWGGTEFSGETSYDSYFTANPTDSFFASSGDKASAVLYPSASPDVISVGGTTLTVTSGKWKSETAWSTGGGGCSRFETATAAQRTYPTYDQSGATCAGKRAMPDIALDASPTTGVAVYDTRKLSTGADNWIKVGGTSASAAMVAGLSASSGLHMTSAEVYGSNIPLYNVTSGSNGHPCQKGYNLCTGLGSWNKTAGTTGQSVGGTLSIGTSPQTVTAGKTSGPIKVALSAAAGTGGVTVTLSTSSSVGQFATAGHTTTGNPLSLVVPAGQTSATFTYEDTKAGAPQISAASSGWSSATQTETIVAGPAASISVTPATVSLKTSATQAFAASAVDSYGNPISGFSPTWTTTVSGAKVSPTTGASTTFTAGTSAAAGKVTATSGSVKGTASVTVTAAVQPTVGVAITAGSATRSGSSYRLPLTVSTTGTAGKLVSASVTLKIYSGSCTGTLLASGSATTGTAGTATFTLTTSGGTYCAIATASHTGYTQGTKSTTFTISSSSTGRAAAPKIAAS